ncbi:MAG TPA: hypothetical protein VEY33_03620 [Gemmatimonadota bacterium]|nr:hypothetical protein [Gemmatimonadota bacterium]
MLYRAELLPDEFQWQERRKLRARPARGKPTTASIQQKREGPPEWAALSRGASGTRGYFFLPFFAFLAGFFAAFEGFLAAFFMAMVFFLHVQVPVRELWITTIIRISFHL